MRPLCIEKSVNLLVFIILTIVFVEVDNGKDPDRRSSSTKSDNIFFLNLKSMIIIIMT
jgi:hypothetical protein